MEIKKNENMPLVLHLKQVAKYLSNVGGFYSSTINLSVY